MIALVWNRSVPTNIDAQEEKDIMKMKTRQITVSAIMLAICIASQFFKNLECHKAFLKAKEEAVQLCFCMKKETNETQSERHET